MDKIKVLSDREQARTKLPIFFGSKDNYYHGIREVIGNARDEIINNFKEGTITVELSDDCEQLTVTDTGRGMPIEGVTDGVPNWQLLFLTLFAGTKYGDNGDITEGTNGVGLTVLNYTCSFMSCVVLRNNEKHTIEFCNGGELVSPLVSNAYFRDVCGTTISFKLDRSIYPNTIYNAQEIRDLCIRSAAISNKITVIYKHKNIEEKFHFKLLEDYFDNIISGVNMELPRNVWNNKSFSNATIDMIWNFSTEKQIQEEFLNGAYLREHGTIQDGVLSGLRTFFNNYCKSKKMIGKNSLTLKDMEGFSYVVLYRAPKVEYSGQTKFSTKSEECKTNMTHMVIEMMEILLVDKPEWIDRIAKYIVNNKKANEEKAKLVETVKKKLNSTNNPIANRVENFIDCKSKKGDDLELFIAEGLSALGSIVLARDANNQAALPLKGKIKNILKSDYKKILNNTTIVDMMKVIGCGIQVGKNKELGNFNMDNMRWDKIIIATDADIDGYHIRTLILTCLWVLAPDLIKAGKVYIAEAPLFEIRDSKDNMYYAFNEKQKDKIIKKIKGKVTIGRAKGLGETSAEAMSHCVLKRDTRHIIKITVDNVDETGRLFDVLLGEKDLERKNYINDNMHKYMSN